MGGTKRKFQRPRYVSKAKFFAAGNSTPEEEEEKKAPPKKEEMKGLLDLWKQSMEKSGEKTIDEEGAEAHEETAEETAVAEGKEKKKKGKAEH